MASGHARVGICVSLCSPYRGCSELELEAGVSTVQSRLPRVFHGDAGRPAGPGFAAHLKIRTWEAGAGRGSRSSGCRACGAASGQQVRTSGVGA